MNWLIKLKVDEIKSLDIGRQNFFLFFLLPLLGVFWALVFSFAQIEICYSCTNHTWSHIKLIYWLPTIRQGKKKKAEPNISMTARYQVQPRKQIVVILRDCLFDLMVVIKNLVWPYSRAKISTSWHGHLKDWHTHNLWRF